MIRATILGEKRDRHWEALSWKLDVNFGSKGNYIGYAIWQLNAPHVDLVCPSLSEKLSALIRVIPWFEINIFTSNNIRRVLSV